MVKGGAYFILALLLFGGIAYYFIAERARALAQIDRRLASIAAPGGAPARADEPVSVPGRVAPLLAQAQIELTTHTLRLMAGAALAITLLTLIVLGPSATVALVIGLPLLVLAWVRHRARTRIDALIEALPYYIDGVRQLQAVGNSLSQALDRALADAPAIVQSYFRPAARRLEMGAPVGDTMEQLADRLRVAEVSMLAAAVKSNQRYGGSLSAVLRNLSHILRERVRIKRELKAATSEAKVSSRVLIAMPMLAMVMLVLLNPNYITFFISDSRGRTLITIALLLQGAGIVVLRRMMRLEF